MVDKRIGNQFWKRRTKHGRDKVFANSESLWNSCCEYFEWVDDNPLWEMKVTQYQGEPVSMEVPKMRAMTLAGLFFYLKISHETWNLYKKRNDFIEVTREAEQIIYSQKFAGAAADLLNANIIARDLGLADKTQTEVSIKPVVKVTDLSGPNERSDD